MTPNQVRARLIERNSNLAKFSKKYGFEARTVYMAISRYVGTGRCPRGILTWRILKKLSQEIGQPVIDGLDKLVNVDNP